MKNNIFFRFGIFIGLLFFLLLLPWWVTLFFSLAALIRFSSYYEILFLGFIFDSLYIVSFFHFLNFPVATSFAFFLLTFSFFIKKYLRLKAGV